MFMLNNGGATCNAMPDVCKTPTPAGPVPIPYPNIASTNMCDPGGLVNKVLLVNMPAINLATKVMLSNGDQAGAAGGVVSNKMMGETQFMLGSMKVMVGGKPAVRLTAMTGQNGSPPNSVGTVIAPSQTKVMVLS